MLKLVCILFLFSAPLSSSFAYERSYAFIVKMFGEYVKVVSPEKYTSMTSVIIENKTLTRIYGKVVTQGGRVITFFAVPAVKVKTVELKLNAGEQAFVVPLSPAFQSFQLKFGSRPYEIPPKK